MQHVTFRILFCLTGLLFASGAFAQVNPIPLTGFNQDGIAEAGPSSIATTTLQLDGGSSNKVMYTNAFRTFAGIAGGGLPDNGTIVSGGDTYQLAPYTGNNALYVYRNETRSLSLVTPTSFARIRVLALTTEGSSSMNISLNFTDGSTISYLSGYTISDWFNGAANIVLQGFGRCDRSAGPAYNADAFPSNPRMYFIDIPLTCTDKSKLLQSITFANVSTFPNNAPFPNAVILAASGIGYTQTITPLITPCDCSGPNGSIALTVTGSTSPYTYSWNTTPVQTGATATGLASGSYTCTITDAGGCTSSYSGTVPLNNNAAMNATANPLAVCPGTSATLIANVTTGNLTSFTWNPGALTGASVVVTPANTTTYTVNGTNTLGCTVNAQVTVTVNPVPAAPVVSNITVCPGANAVLQIQGPLAGHIYYWYDAATGGTLLGTGTSYTLTNVTTNTTVYTEAENGTGCKSATRTPVTVTVDVLPTAPTVNNVTVCPFTDATLQIQNPQAGFTYQWYTTATGGSPVGTGVSYTVTNVTGNTTIYAEAVNAGGCVSAARTAVTITLLQPLASPAVTVTNVTFTSLTFSWNPVPGAVSYEVSTNGGTTYTLPSSGAAGTTHTVSGLAGNTTVTLLVRALRNQPCETSTPGSATGTTLSSKEIFVPNVFTPNGDGKNDVLFVYGNYVATIRLSIFNQWGQLIFESANINTGWNGTYKGQQQPVGVYAYTLKVVLQDGTIINKKGSVNLIR
ncbi:MAG: gliding motility-associated C-terminal domain-containing protein [Bacteroidetes bacterium]|nr:gliding motility-associated C-terminal domain-containing protein [Bacteroidota bacterium]